LQIATATSLQEAATKNPTHSPARTNATTNDGIPQRINVPASLKNRNGKA
jgi:hypothetical protein